jgi:hypothetical protein
VDSVPDPLLLRKSGSVANRTRAFGYVARNSDHYTTEAVELDNEIMNDISDSGDKYILVYK